MAGELRITGGRLARRRIRVPPAADRGAVRPTSDKVRAALFSSLAASPGVALDGARVLDLFAGSGALGFEALSRGAARALFVERDRATARVVADNARALGLHDVAEVRCADAARVLGSLAPGSFDLCLVDPPYAADVDALWPGLLRALAPGGHLVLERDRRTDDRLPMGLSPVFDRVYGDTRVVVLQRPLERDHVAEEARAMSAAAIYPGSFDPLTNGHVDIVTRGLKTFDRVILAIANNPQKSPLFSVEERLEQCRRCLGHLKGIEVDAFDGLIVDYAQKKGVGVLLRGLRAVSDFEYEFQLASMNRKLAPDVDTVFMMTSEESFYLSSRLVREVASLGGDVAGMVPEPVHQALRKQFGTRSKKK